MHFVLLNCIRGVPHPTNTRTQRPIPRFAHPSLDLFLDRIGEFVTAAGEELDAVIRHRVVRCRQHHAQISVQPVGEKCNRRSRKYAEHSDVNTGTCQTRYDRCFQELTACSGIPSDHCGRAMPLESADVPQYVRSSDRQIDRKFRGEIAICQATDTIGAEELTQGSAL